MNNNLADPFYYLENFRFVLTWVLERYRDLLTQHEIEFVEQFSSIPIQSQALLVRMVMRRGNLFRASKLSYPEIGDSIAAALPLTVVGWIKYDSVLSVEQLFVVLTKNEFATALQLKEKGGARKTDLLEAAHALAYVPRRFSEWAVNGGDVLFEVQVADVCDRFRLMFFGNLYQDWSEFVLADLGIFTYEKVSFCAASRAFTQRTDIDAYLHLHACRTRLSEGEALADVVCAVEALQLVNPWLQRRQAKLLYQIAFEFERLDDHAAALQIYARCNYTGARQRQIRVLEKLGLTSDAHALASIAAAAPESADETQHLSRIMPRLARKLGLVVSRTPLKSAPDRIDLMLPSDATQHVEELARCHIAQRDAQCAVYYVENALINSLFGLLCWDAIFSPVQGAFFHPFQAGPADLHSATFHQLRANQFKNALSQLSSHQYQHTIRETFRVKAGIQSPFVYWETLDEALLELALACVPASHLEQWFLRILDGIALNRCGYPDLIQFWPQQQRYRMIEVKGPGDRLQDNQIRFLDFCFQNQMPAAVCYVEWATDDGTNEGNLSD